MDTLSTNIGQTTIGQTTGGALDWLLDRSVVPGYSRIGYALRRRAWDDGEATALRGKHVLVTGGSSGIGTAICDRLAVAGATVHLLGRDEAKAEVAAASISRRLAGGSTTRADNAVVPWACDLADLDAVREFASRFAAAVPVLDGLVHNAGVLNDRRVRSPQGHELTFATHALGPLSLSLHLHEPLRAAEAGRVVFVASGGLYTTGLHLDDLELEQDEYEGPRAYAHAKRIQLVLAGLMSDRWRSDGICVTAMHPGWVDTPGLERSLPRFRRMLRPLLRHPDAGADTAVWLLTAPDPCGEGNALWHDRAPRPAHRVPWTRESPAERELLWSELTRIAGHETNNHENGGT